MHNHASTTGCQRIEQLQVARLQPRQRRSGMTSTTMTRPNCMLSPAYRPSSLPSQLSSESLETEELSVSDPQISTRAPAAVRSTACSRGPVNTKPLGPSSHACLRSCSTSSGKRPEWRPASCSAGSCSLARSPALSCCALFDARFNCRRCSLNCKSAYFLSVLQDKNVGQWYSTAHGRSRHNISCHGLKSWSLMICTRASEALQAPLAKSNNACKSHMALHPYTNFVQVD
jgi:hypothetical protein